MLSLSPQLCLHRGTGAFPPTPDPVPDPPPSPQDAVPWHHNPGPAEDSSGCWVGSQPTPQAAPLLKTPCLSVPVRRALHNAAVCSGRGKEQARNYMGGPRVCSRNSSILMKSVFSSLLNSKKGGLVPGAKSFSSSGFLEWKK